MIHKMKAGRAPDVCRSRKDVLRRYQLLDAIFEETRACGRSLDMNELPRFHCRRAHGATLVQLARDGTCPRRVGGVHRFAIAYILDLPEMPAQLGVTDSQALGVGHLERLRNSLLKSSAIPKQAE